MSNPNDNGTVSNLGNNESEAGEDYAAATLNQAMAILNSPQGKSKYIQTETFRVNLLTISFLHSCTGKEFLKGLFHGGGDGEEEDDDSDDSSSDDDDEEEERR